MVEGLHKFIRSRTIKPLAIVSSGAGRGVEGERW
jgi:hypothetical protein